MRDSTKDRVKGCIYGKAVGDALGIAAEFKSAASLKERYGDSPGPSGYARVVRDGVTWEAGEWSDDTDQALLILESVADWDWLKFPYHRHLNHLYFASRLYHWLEENGKGAGLHTRRVLTEAGFLKDPLDASKRVWLRSNKKAAANGAVMRAAFGGLICPGDEQRTSEVSQTIAKVTHYDPRCVASAVAVAVATSCLVAGESIEKAVAAAARHAKHIEPEAYDWILHKSLSDLDLAEGLDDPNYKGRAPIGYTYKTLGAGFWALRQINVFSGQLLWQGPEMFLRILQKVIMEGGDTDTNAAVAGALVGAALGFENGIPKHLREMPDRDVLDYAVEKCTQVSC